MPRWHGGKGGDKRPTLVNEDEHKLRDELWRSSTPPERKAEIKKLLEKMKKGE